jgi:cobalt/nickel transport system permease protein
MVAMPPSSNDELSVCHRIPSEWKLGLTLLAILTASLIPLENWPALGLLLVTVLTGLIFADASLGYLARRLALFLPLLVVFGLSVPMTQIDRSSAWEWTISLSLRCIVSFLAGLWLIHVLPIPELLTTLLRWHCPKLLVAMLAFMYRYVFILWDELARLRHAREARDFGRSTMMMRWMGNAHLIGLLLLRAMERAERAHRAMLARVWDGSIRFLGEEPKGSR